MSATLTPATTTPATTDQGATCDDCDQPAVCWGPVILAACDFRLCATHGHELRMMGRRGPTRGRQPIFVLAPDGSKTQEPYLG